LEDAAAKTPKKDFVIITDDWKAKWKGKTKVESAP
jgi:hypothetical protein